jgi:predicted SAM-dependent methyltransferase
MKRINIGCGMDYRQGWLNTDLSRTAKCDVVHDIRSEHLPVEDGEVDVVYASGVLEQILLNEHLLFAFNEVWRVLKPGGEFQIVVPNAEFSIAFRDPFDCRQFTPGTFNYFHHDHRHYKLYGSIYGFKPWELVKLDTNANGIMVITMKKHVM